MKLNANLIFDNLPAELDAVYHGQKETALHLLRPEFLEKGQERFRADHVYLVKAQDLPLRPRIEPGALILLLGDSVYLPRYEGKCNVIQLRGAVRLTSSAVSITALTDGRNPCGEYLTPPQV